MAAKPLEATPPPSRGQNILSDCRRSCEMQRPIQTSRDIQCIYIDALAQAAILEKGGSNITKRRHRRDIDGNDTQTVATNDGPSTDKTPMTSEESRTEIHPEETQKSPSLFHMVAEQAHRSGACLLTTPSLHNDYPSSSFPTASLTSTSTSQRYGEHLGDPHLLPDELWRDPSTSSSRTSLEEHGDSLLRHRLASPEVCHQALVDPLHPGVSALELCLPSTPPSRQVAVPAAIATTAAAGAAATTSSSSRLCICCAVAEMVATSPTTSRGKRGEHQGVPALSLLHPHQLQIHNFYQLTLQYCHLTVNH